MPGKPKRPGGHGYGRRSKKYIGRRFNSSQQKSTVLNENVLDDHDKVISLIILNAHSYLCKHFEGCILVRLCCNKIVRQTKRHITMPL